MSIDSHANLVSLVRPQIEATLGEAQAAMAKHVAQVAGNSALTGCPLQLHQVWGALRMAQLDGPARFGAELEAALRVSTRSASAERIEIECIGRAIGALRDFVNDVAAGGACVPLRLFPEYRNLARVSGNESATEKDLFFPETPGAGQPPPAHAEPRAITPAVLPALLKEMRTRYQRGLLGWLKESAKPDGLVQMREVLDSLYKIAAQLPEPRGLWWAATALIDAAIEALPDARMGDWLARVKPACGRIDFVLRDLAARPDADTGTAHRDVLYAVATSPAPTARLREVRAYYQLDSLLPSAPDAGTGAGGDLKPALDDAGARLENIKDTWTEYAAGEPKRLTRFRDMLAQLTEKSSALGNAPLTQLLEAIGGATANLPDPYPLDGQVMSLEMAAALLMAESIVQHFNALPDDLEQQVAIMRGWLADAAQGKTAGASPPGLRADIVQKVNDAKLRTATAREIVKSLAQVEKTVEAFTRDHGKHDTLPPLATAMRQVAGVFQVSNQRRAARLATLCQRLIERCANPAHTGLAQDLEWIAEGLGSLGFYLEPCQQGKEPTERAVNMFFTRYEQQAGNDALLTLTHSMPAAIAATAAAAAPTSPLAPAVETPAPPLVAPARDAIDREMLDVFLEEASEVLAAIEASTAQLHTRADDPDALLSVRRAFHTLKGSSRMVGLTAFGESAWQMEQVMNHWRAQTLAATPELLLLVKDAREVFAEWTYALQGGEEQLPDAGGIAARARELRGEPAVAPPVAAAAVAVEPVVAAEPAVPPDAAPQETEFMTGLLPAAAAQAPDFMTVVMPATAATPAPAEEEPLSPARQCDQALADLGDRLAWINGLIEEIDTQTSTNVMANSRLREIAHMLHESMAEAGALHRSLAGHIAELKKNA
jgi:chemosensory pili system protein ChpA (sensor histidine kinase/response regulator)